GSKTNCTSSGSSGQKNSRPLSLKASPQAYGAMILCTVGRHRQLNPPTTLLKKPDASLRAST
ncbi:MAG: hypothetical protein M1415_02580, partial [Firmicutes bacterium]|nr:hypothetical protein [Bacillota bacterium]